MVFNRSRRVGITFGATADHNIEVADKNIINTYRKRIFPSKTAAKKKITIETSLFNWLESFLVPF